MYFNKIPPSANFHYRDGDTPLLHRSEGELALSVTALGGGVFRYRVNAARWQQKSQAPLDTAAFHGRPTRSALTHSPSGVLELRLEDRVLLRSTPDRPFGVLGQKWALSLEHSEDMHFYGLGEKNTGFEKTGHICKFWNTDAFADFGPRRVEHEATDPLYASIPYLLIKRPQGCIGILINNPHPVFMNLAAKENIANLLDAREAQSRSILLGSYDGEPEIFFIIGADVKEVTTRLQRLCGLAPLPPLWSLGYHQCRFGYRDLADLEALDSKFTEHRIPCDGLWLDIDYMDGFRVFTVTPEGFARHAQRIRALQAKGRKIVPILDPGVKNEPGNAVFEDGRKADVFCKTCEGDLYSGFVWPGRTAFPDYSLARGRAWWTEHVRRFTETYGFDAYWIDMNDPSTGSSELEDMLFNEGTDSHSSYHNQYALGMAEATAAGLRAARPSKRTFVLSRSGYIGIARYCALWTGDNWSNHRHLREGIAMSLNLSLSGVAFNGPDVPGFAGDASPELAVDWHKAAFLFPFFRNHSAIDAKPQEPWRFPEAQREVIAHYIRLRYKFIPYLYGLFRRQSEWGEPIIRPLLYDFPGGAYDLTGDQFMVGPSVMQAPIVQELSFRRQVLLPAGEWFDARTGVWLSGARTIEVATTLESTPCFIRGGSVIPMLRGETVTPAKNLAEVELHLFVHSEEGAEFDLDYEFDDGETPAEQNPPVTRLSLRGRVEGGKLHVRVTHYLPDYQPLSVQFVAHDSFDSLCVEQGGEREWFQLEAGTVRLTGQEIAVHHTPFFALRAPIA